MRALRAEHVCDLIGSTPVVRLNRVVPPGSAAVYLKLESFNPGGSVKDRVALALVRDAEARGRLRPGMRLLEATSGNTCVGLALVGAALGYGVTLVMPDTMTQERRALLKAYGAELVLTPGGEGMKGAVARAEAMAAADPRYLPVRQFENPANPEAHRQSTALELLEQLPELDAFVAGVGTGGTLSGVASVLAARKPGVRVVAVEPAESPLLSTGQAGPHGIQGIGANFVPQVLDREACTRIETVTTAQAVAMARRLAREEGLLGGISSGAAAHAALKVAAELGAGHTVAAVLCDTGERYLSHPVYSEA